MIIPYVVLLVTADTQEEDSYNPYFLLTYKIATIVMILTQIIYIVLYFNKTRNANSVSHTQGDQEQMRNANHPLIQMNANQNIPNSQRQGQQINLNSNKFWNGSFTDWVIFRFTHTFIILAMWVLLFVAGYHSFVGFGFFIIELFVYIYTTYEWFE
mmetsp:Transcript_28373/g.25094  ORF Transcript_28373/g.25094 Transcript_28373/m.25094 type:complete len:156 (+) Transcript_28373:62-529(+)